MFTTSQEIKNIGKALITFNDNIGVIPKNDNNPAYKSKYAGLPTILKAIKEPLKTAGLALTQLVEGETSLVTLIIHAESGEWIRSVSTLTPSVEFKKREMLDEEGNVMFIKDNWGNQKAMMMNDTDNGLHTDPQKQCAATTYDRRRAITAILRLDVDEDDDGNTASGVKVPETTVAQPPKVFNTVPKEPVEPSKATFTPDPKPKPKSTASKRPTTPSEWIKVAKSKKELQMIMEKINSSTVLSQEEKDSAVAESRIREMEL